MKHPERGIRAEQVLTEIKKGLAERQKGTGRRSDSRGAQPPWFLLGTICRVFLRVSLEIMRLDYWEDLKENSPGWVTAVVLTLLVLESTQTTRAKSPMALEFDPQGDDATREL